jgi:hypothetical protein
MGDFDSYVDRSGGPDACHVWTAGHTGIRHGLNGPVGGYGAYYPRPGHQVLAHRFAYEREHGRIPDGLQTLHSCDNPPCCNVRHLSIGTGRQNRHDCESKRRHYHGEQTHTNILTEAQVLQILARLAEGARGCDLSDDFGVTRSMISRIKHRKAWKHLQESL